MRLIFILLFISSVSWSIDLDIDLLKREVSQNPNNVNERLILARSYIGQSDYDKAKKLLDEILRIDKKNQKAHFLIKDIKKLKQIEELVKSGKLTKSSKLTAYLKKLSESKKYKYITLFADVLKRNNITLNADGKFYIIDSYIQAKEYKKSENLLEKSSLSSQNKHFLKAKIEVNKHNYILSEQEYKKALSFEEREDIVLGLYDVYMKLGKSKEAEELAKFYNKKDPKSSISKALQKRDKKHRHKVIATLKEDYEQKDSFDTLKKYYYSLEANGQKSLGISTLSSYVKKHPKDEKPALFLAKIYSWNKNAKLSLSTLKPVVNKTKNREILRLYVDMLLQSKQRDKAYKYMKKLVFLGDDKSKNELEKIQTNSLLEDAISAHKVKNYPRAIRNYKAYYSKTKDSKIAKEIAELLFVEKKAKESLPYYKAYLAKNPDDNKIRFRYASALDSLKLYKKSEYQYKKVAKKRDELYALSTYRYAASLIEQKDEKKWNLSRSVLQNLLKTLKHQTKFKDRDSLLKFTKATLKKVNKPMQRPTKYKDIILAEGQKKIIENEYTLVGSKIVKQDISSVKSMLTPLNESTNMPKKRDVSLSLHYLEDNTISNISCGIRVNNIAKVANGTLSVETKKSRFKSAKVKHNVESFMTTFVYKNFSFGLGMSQFGEFNDVDVDVSYRKILSGHDLTLGLKSTNGAFVNSNACMIDNKINVIQFSLYDAILLSNLDQAQLGLTLNRYDDKNINLNSWLEYPLHKASYNNFENDFSLSGSYEINSKTDTCYYSTKFYDGNYIQMRPKILFGKKGFIQGVGGIGYSFENGDVLYKYGLSAVITLKLFDIRVDCRHYQSGYSPDGADECFATAAYKW